VSEKLLDRADVVTVFQEMRRERVTQGVARRSLDDASLEDGLSDGPLHD
jgi:hypothetical protein